MLKTLVARDEDTDELEVFALVDKHGGASVTVNNCDVTLISSGARAFYELIDCTVGDFTAVGLIVSINGEPVRSSEEIREAVRLKEEKLEREEQQRKVEKEHLVQIEKERQEEQRIRQEQLKEEIYHKQQTANKLATQYERTTNSITFDDAVSEMGAIKHYIGEEASSQIIRERAIYLRSRCDASRTAVPVSNTASTASSGDGAKVGAIVGGILGLFGGPFIAIAFATLGSVVGDTIASSNSSTTTNTSSNQTNPEREKWTKLIQEIDEIIKRFPQEQGGSI